MKKPQLNYSKCLSCGMCVQECPVSALSMEKLGKQGKYSNIFPLLSDAKCIGCGGCARACVMGCITMAEQPGQ